MPPSTRSCSRSSNRYGYQCTADLVAAGSCSLAGAPAGGGTVGFGTTFDGDNFFRDAGQVGYNLTAQRSGDAPQPPRRLQQSVDSEDLTRSSNGWGSITVPGGGTSFQGTPIFYIAAYQQQGIGAVPTIHSEYHSQNIEVNDTINWKNWTFNVGLLDSHDTLYGQGLNNADGTLSGYVLATGTTSASRQYKMYTMPFEQAVPAARSARPTPTTARTRCSSATPSTTRWPARCRAPRRGTATWRRRSSAYFDANGNLFANDPLASSSGKLFVPNMTPPTHNEWLIGTAREFGANFTGRAYFRYNRGTHYWEDTNNTARLPQAQGGFNRRRRCRAPTSDSADALHPEPDRPAHADRQSAGLGRAARPTSSPSSTARSRGTRRSRFEAEYHKGKAFVRGSYTWQPLLRQLRPGQLHGHDRRTTPTSSSARRTSATAPGRQLWDNKLGTLRGDRPNSFKLYGSYNLPWNASRRHLHRGAVGPAVGEVGLHALQRLHDVDERDDQVRGARRLAARAVARADGPEVHAELPVRQAPHRADRRRSVQRRSTRRPATTSSRASTRPATARRRASSIRGGCRWRSASCSRSEGLCPSDSPTRSRAPLRRRAPS